MLELPVTARRRHEEPTIVSKQFEHIADFHGVHTTGGLGETTGHITSELTRRRDFTLAEPHHSSYETRSRCLASNELLYGASIIWKKPIFIESLHELLRLQAPPHISICSFD